MCIFTELNRAKNLSEQEKIKRSMEQVGYLEDQVMMVIPSGSARGQNQRYDVHDGNTRLGAAMELDEIKEIPCLVLHLPKGITIRVICYCDNYMEM